MRPWRKVAQEVAARGPQDLRPLAFKPPHGELAALVDNINALLQRVDASAARERSFIADATHELRTPLAAMRVNVEALQGQAHDARQQELLDGILNSGNRAARLVGQLLQLTRSEVQAGAGELPRRQALDTLLQDRLAALSGLAQAGDIELELQASVSLSVPGQRESLVSLIDNLVENAIKYSPRGSSVTVSLHAERGQAVLHVADQGPGIAPALYARVFDRFSAHRSRCSRAVAWACPSSLLSCASTEARFSYIAVMAVWACWWRSGCPWPMPEGAGELCDMA